IVLRTEHTLPACLALSACNRPECVETPGNRWKKAPFCLDVGCNHAKTWRLRLIGPVASPKTLNGNIGPPSSFKQVMQALSLVPTTEIGMIGTPRSTGFREDQDLLLIIHEGARFIEIGTTGPTFDSK